MLPHGYFLPMEAKKNTLAAYINRKEAKNDMEPDWQKIYLLLYAFADQLLKNYSWFRGKNAESSIGGKQPHDYAADVIEMYLLAPEKYDSSKMSLVGYLKKHILRRAVFNDAVSSENRTTKKLPSPGKDDDNDQSLIDLLFSRSDSTFDQVMDFDKIMAEIEEGVKEDRIASLIFEGTGRDGLKRREIMEQKCISDTDYDNGMKRLKTVLRQVIRKYEINEPKRIKKKETNEETT